MVISPQLGQGNFVASIPGGMIRLHDVQAGMVTLASLLNYGHLKGTPYAIYSLIKASQKIHDL